MLLVAQTAPAPPACEQPAFDLFFFFICPIRISLRFFMCLHMRAYILQKILYCILHNHHNLYPYRSSRESQRLLSAIRSATIHHVSICKIAIHSTIHSVISTHYIKFFKSRSLDVPSEDVSKKTSSSMSSPSK